MNLDDLPSPKLSPTKDEWESLFPYYAGFSRGFAEAVLEAGSLRADHRVFDPWNGAGTTTTAAAAANHVAEGFDLNPVMNVVAKARAVNRDSADILLPLAKLLLRARSPVCLTAEPLTEWFDQATASRIRSLAASIEKNASGGLAELGLPTSSGISAPAAVMYVALFSACRTAVRSLRTSNPTWLKSADKSDRVSVSQDSLDEAFLSAIQSATLHAYSHGMEDGRPTPNLRIKSAADSPGNRFDLILTSPPYCTRLDYAHLTKLELSIFSPMSIGLFQAFRESLTGTTITRGAPNKRLPNLGARCNELLDGVRTHKSRASSGYYYRNHLDYYNKMSRSVRAVSRSLRANGVFILVVQDSWYKDIHNDVPNILADFCQRESLVLEQQKDFRVRRSLADVHKHRAAYTERRPIQETVMCFRRSAAD